MTGEASLRVMLGNLAVALLFLLPLVTMRHFAEERRAGTFELLMTAPVPLWALLAGKWAASVALCALLLAGTGIFPLLLAFYGDPDWGVIATSYLGLLLCCGAFVSAGLFTSSLTQEPVAAGLGGVIAVLTGKAQDIAIGRFGGGAILVWLGAEGIEGWTFIARPRAQHRTKAPQHNGGNGQKEEIERIKSHRLVLVMQ